MRKFIKILMVVAMVFNLCTFSVFADSDVTVYVNGNKVNFDIPPTTGYGITLLSEKPIFKALGFSDVREIEDFLYFFTERNGEYYMFDGANNLKKYADDSSIFTSKETGTCSSFFSDRYQAEPLEIAERFNCDVWEDTKTHTIYFTEKPDAYVNNIVSLYSITMSYGLGYYKEGYYYEAIDEFQAFCDEFWDKMSPYQQSEAVSYINSAKTDYANYLFESGKNDFMKGLYYESKDSFGSAVYYYEQVNSPKAQEARDCIALADNKIKQWENRPVRSKSGKIYKTYKDSIIPMLENFVNLSYNNTIIDTRSKIGRIGMEYQYYLNNTIDNYTYSGMCDYLNTLLDNGFLIDYEYGDTTFSLSRGRNTSLCYYDSDNSMIRITIFN